jgi:hypothetical protein
LSGEIARISRFSLNASKVNRRRRYLSPQNNCACFESPQKIASHGTKRYNAAASFLFEIDES